MALMALSLDNDARIELLKAAAKILGSNAALGRALGYQDGAFVGQMLRGERPVSEKTVRAMDDVHALRDLVRGAKTDQPQPLVAGDLQGLYEFTVPPMTAWEALMNISQFPDLIRFCIPDDALADRLPRGTDLIMSTTDLAPEPGQVVLVEDRDGSKFVRRYACGRGGHWQAIASNPVYPSLDAHQDGLKLLAVVVWVNGRQL